MHISVFHHKSHLFAKGLHVLASYKLETRFAAIMICVLLVAYGSYQSLVSGTAVGSSDSVRPLTLLDDPHSVHEYAQRAQDILTHLDGLKNQAQADRVYAVSYSYDLTRFGTMVKISKTFEIGQIDEFVPVSHYQDLSRMNWLDFRQSHTMSSGLYPSGDFPQGYGEELYDDDGNAIGYLGIDYQRNVPKSQVNDIELLRQTARAKKISFLQPFEAVNGRE